MKFLLVVFTVSAITVVAYAALAIIPADETPGHPGHCNSNTTGPLSKDESKTIENCIRAECNDDGSIQLATCGVIATPCGLTEPDLTKPYPDCCPQPKPCY